jgi:hypothetical protein
MLDAFEDPARAIMRNRHSVLKAQAKAGGHFFAWPEYPAWEEEVRRLLSQHQVKSFDPKAWQVYYERAGGGYPLGSMRVRRVAKEGARRGERAEKLLKAPDEEEGTRRAILAAELSIRLLSWKYGQTFQEILQESLAAAGIDP